MSRTAILLAVAGGIMMAALAAGIVLAQPGQVPPPYTGVKNPFPWNDADAQKAGRPLYQANCLCHGPDGASLQDVDFSTPGFPATLEKYQDFYFYVVSEGESAKGMPGFKSTLSDTEVANADLRMVAGVKGTFHNAAHIRSTALRGYPAPDGPSAVHGKPAHNFHRYSAGPGGQPHRRCIRAVFCESEFLHGRTHGARSGYHG